MWAAEEPFQAASHSFNAGAFVIRLQENQGARDRIERAAKELGLKAYAVNDAPKTPMHELAAPRIALVCIAG
jgi:hypothetical protein